MVNGYVSADDVHLQGHTGLPEQLPQARGNLSAQDRLTILGHLHQVIFQVIHSVRCFSVAHDCIVKHRLGLSTRPGGGPRLSPVIRRSAQPDLDTFAEVKTACLKGRGFDPIYRQ